MFTRRERVAAGGLASYSVSLDEPFRLASAYVARILRGEKPVDLRSSNRRRSIL